MSFFMILRDDTPTGKRARTRDDLLAAAQDLLLSERAGSLGVKQVAVRAGVVHGTLYNHFPSVEALVDEVAMLIGGVHAALAAPLRTDGADLVRQFARITRQTLHAGLAPGYGRLMFDAGLPVDRFIGPMRMALRVDLAEGMRQGLFRVDDLDLAVSLTIGAALGVGIDLHRGLLPAGAIEPATARLLEGLGVEREAAVRIAHEPLSLREPPPLPLRWTTVRKLMEETSHA
jgi:AcrR family transcriptional regulator